LAEAARLMGYFPSARAADLQGNTVRADLLVMFDFVSGAMRLWQGFGTLRTNDDNEWQGIGQLGRIGDLESTIAGDAPQATFTLSGVDTAILSEAMNTSDEVYGRDVNVYIQFFDENFAPLDDPYVCWAGTMDVMHVKQNADTCTIELTAESIFFRRASPPLGTLSDRDQQRFYPGDRGLAIMPGMVAKAVLWPVIPPQP
jgi:hypothetical protein